MKRFYILAILSIIIMCGACENSATTSINNMALNINTFDTPISCIAPSTFNNILFLGLEDGSIIEKVQDSCRRYSIGSNHRIYDIEEYKDEQLFIGTRDAGLKLLNNSDGSISTFYIKDKNYHYSVYSIVQDSLNHILYIGTSNGFYKLNLDQDILNNELEPIKFIDNSEHVGVNKIVFHADSILLATTAGLYATKNNPATLDFKTPLINTAIRNVIVHKNRCFVSSESSVQEIIGGKRISTHKVDKPYFYFRNDDEEWIVNNKQLTFNHNNHKLHYQFNNGISSNGKQIAHIGKNFLYIACKEQLLAFALHQNTIGAGNRVIAMSDKKSSDTIFFITDDAYLHYYNFKYNKPAKASFCLNKIKDLKLNDDVVKFVEGEKGVFYLATSQEVFKIVGNQATAILQIKKGQPHKSDPFNRINTIYYSNTTKQLYVGTRGYLGVLHEEEKSFLKAIPLIDNRGLKDTLDAYVVDLCEKRGKLYVASLNKGLYEKEITDSNADLTLIKDLSEYESCYNLIINGQTLYLNTSLGILNLQENTLMKIKQVKSIAGIHEKNPNEGYFILYYHGLSFKGLEDHKSPLPKFTDLSFKKSSIAVNGRKALLGNNSGLFLFDDNRLIPIRINNCSKDFNGIYIGVVIIMAISIFIGIFLYRKKGGKKKETEGSSDKESPYQESELQDDIANLETQVKQLFDALNSITAEEEESMRKEIKEKCLHFADKYSDLSLLPFMKHRGRDRFNITILLFIKHIDANIISRVLDVNQLTVNRHKYNARKEIERLYDKGFKNNIAIDKLYEVIQSSRK